MTFESEYAEDAFTNRSPSSHRKRRFGSCTKRALQSLIHPLDKEKLLQGQCRWVVRWGEYYFYLSFQALTEINECLNFATRHKPICLFHLVKLRVLGNQNCSLSVHLQGHS